MLKHVSKIETQNDSQMISNMCPGHEFRDEKIFYFVSAKK
jgi:hypothetical protein